MSSEDGVLANLPPEGKRTTAHILYNFIAENSNVTVMSIQEILELAQKQSHKPLSTDEIKGMSATSKYRWVRNEENRQPGGDGQGNFLFYQQPLVARL